MDEIKVGPNRLLLKHDRGSEEGCFLPTLSQKVCAGAVHKTPYQQLSSVKDSHLLQERWESQTLKSQIYKSSNYIHVVTGKFTSTFAHDLHLEMFKPYLTIFPKKHFFSQLVKAQKTKYNDDEVYSSKIYATMENIFKRQHIKNKEDFATN